MTHTDKDLALFVVPGLEVGGAERHTALLAQHLDRSRWQVRIATFKDGPLGDELRQAGVSVDVLPASQNPRDVRAASSAMDQYLSVHRPSVVSTQHFAADLVVRLAMVRRARRREQKIPYVVWKHTFGHIGHRGLRDRTFEAATGHLVTGYGAVCFTQVNYLREELGLPTKKVRVVQNSLPLSQRSAAPHRRQGQPASLQGGNTAFPTVAMVAAFRRDKGHEDLLQAWHLVAADHPRARLLLVGDGPDRRRVERLAANLPGVHFLGVRTDAPDIAAAADVLVLASYNIECFPYAVLEAMNGSVAVVSTATGGLAEMIVHGKTGLLVPPRAPRALGLALSEVLASPDRARSLGTAGRARLAEDFPFDRWVSQINDSYAEWTRPERGIGA